MTELNSEIKKGHFLQKAYLKSENVLKTSNEQSKKDGFLERYKLSIIQMNGRSKSSNASRDFGIKGNTGGLNLRSTIRNEQTDTRSTHNKASVLQPITEKDGQQLNGPKLKESKTEGEFIPCQNCGSYSEDCNKCDRCDKLLLPNHKMYLKDKNCVDQRVVTSSVSTETFYKRKIPQQVYHQTIQRRPVHARTFNPEPVCLTISSDEEEQIAADSRSPEIKSSVIHPVPNPEFPVKRILLSENSSSSQVVSLKCRSIRIGSFRYVPDIPVMITENEVLIHASLVNGKCNISINLQLEDISELCYYIGKDMPVIFILTTPSCANDVCTKLNMREDSDVYFNPAANSDTQKRITILPDTITDDKKMNLLGTFRNMKQMIKVNDFTHAEANRMLVQCTPKPKAPLRETRSTRSTEMKNASTTHSMKFPSGQTMITYPPPPQTGGITITSEDYSCLDDGQFLNDVIIDFYLKYLVQNKLSEVDRQRTHVFSSFFWRRLTQRAVRKSLSSDQPKLSLADQRHARVKTWTRHTDIFQKDFIIIPINERLHWFLAIICFSTLDAPQPFSEYKTNSYSSENNAESPAQAEPMEEDRDMITNIDEETMSEENDENSSSANTLLGNSAQVEEDGSNTADKAKSPIVQPCILFFDSLPTGGHGRIASTLREYLRIEWQVKKGSVRKFEKEKMKGVGPKVPTQDNHSDCGIFLLQYVESFFEDPIKDFSIPIKCLEDWFSKDKVAKKRSEIQQLILDLRNKQQVSSSGS